MDGCSLLRSVDYNIMLRRRVDCTQTASTQWTACNHSDTTTPMTLLQQFISARKRSPQYAYCATSITRLQFIAPRHTYRMSLFPFLYFVLDSSLIFSCTLWSSARWLRQYFCVNGEDRITCRWAGKQIWWKFYCANCVDR